MPNPNDGHGGTAVPRRSRLTRSLYRNAVGPRRRGVVKLPDAGRRLEHGRAPGRRPFQAGGTMHPLPPALLPPSSLSSSPRALQTLAAPARLLPSCHRSLDSQPPPATASRVDCRCRQVVVKCRRASSGLGGLVEVDINISAQD